MNSVFGQFGSCLRLAGENVPPTGRGIFLFAWLCTCAASTVLAVETAPAEQQYAPPPNPPTIIAPPTRQLSTESQSSRAEPIEYSIGAPTDSEQLSVELINRARADAEAEATRLSTIDDPDILNAYESFDVDLDQFVEDMKELPASLPPLAINAELMAAARLHSQDMLNNVFQGHFSSDNPPAPFDPGDSIGDRADALGYEYSSIGENVFAYAKSVIHGHAGFEVDWGKGPGGMQDPPGHRQLIHSAGNREIGVGIVEGTNSDGDTEVGPLLITQDFADPREDKAFVTGVAYFDLDSDGFYDPGEGIGGLRVDVEGSDFFAVTAGSGGYAVPVDNGTRTVTFSGLGFEGAEFTAAISSEENVKVDFTPGYTPPAVSGPRHPAIGESNSYSLTDVYGATSLRVEIRDIDSEAWKEDAEGTDDKLIDGTDDSYELVTEQTSATGDRSMHLAHDTAPVDVQTVTLDRTVLPSDSSRLEFSKRLGVANVDQKVEAQISADDGLTWETLWSQFGSLIEGNEGTQETEFSGVSTSVSQYAGEGVRIRFRFLLEYNPDANPDGSTNWFPGTSEGYGVYLDDITITNSSQLGEPDVRELADTATFSFTPEDDTAVLLRARAINNADGDEFAHEYPWGAFREVVPEIKYTVTFSPGDHGSLDEGTPEVSMQVPADDPFPAPPTVSPSTGWLFDAWSPTPPDNVTEPLSLTATYRPDYQWSCTLEIAGAQPEILTVGMVSGATDDVDRDMDAPIDQPASDETAAYLYNGSADQAYEREIIDTAERGEWFLVVQTDAETPVELSWSFPHQLPENRYLTLYQVDAEHVPLGGSARNTAVDAGITAPAGKTAFFVIRYADDIVADLALRRNWNLISLPVQPHEPAVEILFDNDQYVVRDDALDTADGTLYVDDILAYDPAEGYQAVSQLQAKTGAWVRAERTAILLIPGLPPVCEPLDLPAGWNLIGPARTRALPTMTDLVRPAWTWNADTQKYQRTATLSTSKGHWIFARFPISIPKP